LVGKLRRRVLDPSISNLFSDNRIQKALVFCAAALKGITPIYDDPISDSAFDLGVEFFDV
jgi:hypothetical protein